MVQELAQKIFLPTLPPNAQGTPYPTIEFQGPFPTLTGTPGKIRFESLGDILSLALQYVFPIAGFLLFILIVMGGFQWLTSAGDPKKIEGARNRITSAVVGFILLVASYWIVKIVNMILSPNQPFF